MKAPQEIDEKALVLMADIFPTGYYGAKNAFGLLNPEERKDAVVVVIGCGPVGLCAIIAALEHKPKHLFAVDGVESRLDLAKGLGAEPLNFMKDRDGMFARVKEVTEGRGADAVIEVVGLSPALRTAYDLLRPFGVISSIGVHNAEVRSRIGLNPRWNQLTLSRFRGMGTMLTSKPESIPRQSALPHQSKSTNLKSSKNLKIQMGRCPVRSVFPEALKVLTKNQHRVR